MKDIECDVMSVAIEITALRDCILPSNCGEKLHGLFFELLRGFSRDLVPEVHRGPGSDRSPFTISPLKGGCRSGGPLVEVGKDSSLRFTVSSLMRDLSSVLRVEFADKLPGTTTKLARQPFLVSKVVATGGTPVSYEQVLERNSRAGEEVRDITFEFQSPTAFSHSAKTHHGKKMINLLFPTPRRVFTGIEETWNDFSPITIDCEVGRLADRYMFVSRYHDMNTRILDFKTHPEAGFVGTCVYQMQDSAPAGLVRSILALADFARYSGVGMKTAMGMGSVAVRVTTA